MVNAYRDKLPKLLGKDPKKYEVSVVNNLESGNVNDGTAISTYIFADNLDIMIAPTDVIERYATGGVLADLSEWLPADILAAIPEEDRLLSEVKGLSEGQHYVAFRINNSLMSRTCIPPKEDENIKDEEYYALPYDMYLAIHPANKDRLPDVYDVIRQFLGLPIPERQE